MTFYRYWWYRISNHAHCNRYIVISVIDWYNGCLSHLPSTPVSNKSGQHWFIHWLPARWAFGFSGDHQQNINVYWFTDVVSLLMYAVDFSVGNKVTTTSSNGLLVAYSAPSHYLDQCWVIVNWILRTNCRDILIKTQNFSFKKMYPKTSSAKRQPSCPWGDELTHWRHMAT